MAFQSDEERLNYKQHTATIWRSPHLCANWNKAAPKNYIAFQFFDATLKYVFIACNYRFVIETSFRQMCVLKYVHMHMSPWFQALKNYLLELTGKPHPERAGPGKSGTFLFKGSFWIKQIYDKTKDSPGQISVYAPPRPSPLCLKHSDIWKRAEKANGQM